MLTHNSNSGRKNVAKAVLLSVYINHCKLYTNSKSYENDAFIRLFIIGYFCTGRLVNV